MALRVIQRQKITPSNQYNNNRSYMSAQIYRMAKDSIDIQKTVQEAETLLAQSNDLPLALETSINMLLLVVKLLVDRTGLNSRNSSKPPSSDPNREKKAKTKSGKPRSGQKNHKRHNLELVEEPDEIDLLLHSLRPWLALHSMAAVSKPMPFRLYVNVPINPL